MGSDGKPVTTSLKVAKVVERRECEVGQSKVEGALNSLDVSAQGWAA